MESKTLLDTEAGTPQGGIMSPVLCNITLDGLEKCLAPTLSLRKRHKLNIVRYADDMIITGADADFLKREIQPKVSAFLAERGLSLSEEKTKLSHIDDGFDFLGFNVRKYHGKLLIKPEDGKTHALIKKVKEFMRSHRGIPFHVMLLKLNRILRGWAYAYRRSVAKQRMYYVDNQIYYEVNRWLKREHRSKTQAWINKRYRKRIKGSVNFCASYRTKSGRRVVQRFKAASLPIRYHTKVKSEAIPYDPAYEDYFAERERKRKMLAIIDRATMNSSWYERLVA